MGNFHCFYSLTVKALIRDRLVHIFSMVVVAVFLLIPVFSMFSMRQVQELSVTLCLSAISFILLIFTILSGASSVWRDVEKRYTASILGLPVSRAEFVLGKFSAIAVLIVASAIIMGFVSCLVITLTTLRYPSDIPINWFNFFVAVSADALKYVMLLSIALLFSTMSTSFFLPFFASISVYFAGNASQEVFDYVGGEYGNTIPFLSRMIIKCVYYVIPNFAVFNMKVQAVYALPLTPAPIFYAILYFICYTGIMLCLSVWSFNRRELA
jgi:ABC-type transport system involved in multi-copper enzyme maturation permease subunit